MQRENSDMGLFMGVKKCCISWPRNKCYMWKAFGLNWLKNTEANHQAYQRCLSLPRLGQYASGAILFEETLLPIESLTTKGRKIVDHVLVEPNIIPGIKVDKGLVPLAGSNNESWCLGLDGLASCSAAYYQHGACFAKE